MPALIGDLIRAGDVARAIWAFRRNGGGAEGWAAAFRMIRERHPDSASQTIHALITRAQEVWAISNRYQSASPGYRPPFASLPDLRRSSGGGWGSGQQRPPPQGQGQFYHEIGVEIRDPNRGGQLVQVFGHTEASTSILTRGELERIGEQLAQSYLQKFLEYDRRLPDDYDFQATVKIYGAYVGM